ncbi:hypothetical protein HDU93_009732 [Gonapodya sp. JEL0774]|nr:hypothetical protein HDU93_009732 [Gonapodya sp. JEL0774]
MAKIFLEIRKNDDMKRRLAEEKEQLQSQLNLELAKALPAVLSAQRDIEKLDKAEISELRSTISPPRSVATIMELVTFNKDSLSASSMIKVEGFTGNRDFDPKQVEKLSKPAALFAAWVLAVESYYNASLMLLPLRRQLSDIESKMAQLDLNNAKSKKVLDRCEAKLNEMKSKFDQMAKQKDAAYKVLQTFQLRHRSAQQMLTALAPARERWTQLIAKWERRWNNLLGDSLLAASTVAYLSEASVTLRGTFLQQIKKNILASPWDFLKINLLWKPTLLQSIILDAV